MKTVIRDLVSVVLDSTGQLNSNNTIDFASHQYSDSSPISGSLMEWIGEWMSKTRSNINQLLMQVEILSGSFMEE